MTDIILAERLDAIRKIARGLRDESRKTKIANYAQMMARAAVELEAEADALERSSHIAS
jgi:hypothetical protein